MTPSNLALTIGALCTTVGLAMIYLPLAILAVGAFSLLVSVALARSARADRS